MAQYIRVLIYPKVKLHCNPKEKRVWREIIGNVRWWEWVNGIWEMEWARALERDENRSRGGWCFREGPKIDPCAISRTCPHWSALTCPRYLPTPTLTLQPPLLISSDALNPVKSFRWMRKLARSFNSKK